MVFIVPVFAVTAFLSVAFNQTSIYLAPLQALYESFALASYYLLVLAYVQEDDEEREVFFETSGVIAVYRVSQRAPGHARPLLTRSRKRPSPSFSSRW
jgi:hypothetical protein